MAYSEPSTQDVNVSLVQYELGLNAGEAPVDSDALERYFAQAQDDCGLVRHLAGDGEHVVSLRHSLTWTGPGERHTSMASGNEYELDGQDRFVGLSVVAYTSVRSDDRVSGHYVVEQTELKDPDNPYSDDPLVSDSFQVDAITDARHPVIHTSTRPNATGPDDSAIQRITLVWATPETLTTPTPRHTPGQACPP